MLYAIDFQHAAQSETVTVDVQTSRSAAALRLREICKANEALGTPMRFDRRGRLGHQSPDAKGSFSYSIRALQPTDPNFALLSAYAYANR